MPASVLSVEIQKRRQHGSCQRADAYHWVPGIAGTQTHVCAKCSKKAINGVLQQRDLRKVSMKGYLNWP